MLQLVHLAKNKCSEGHSLATLCRLAKTTLDDNSKASTACASKLAAAADETVVGSASFPPLPLPPPPEPALFPPPPEPVLFPPPPSLLSPVTERTSPAAVAVDEDEERRGAAGSRDLSNALSKFSTTSSGRSLVCWNRFSSCTMRTTYAMKMSLGDGVERGRGVEERNSEYWGVKLKVSLPVSRYEQAAHDKIGQLRRQQVGRAS